MVCGARPQAPLFAWRTSFGATDPACANRSVLEPPIFKKLPDAAAKLPWREPIAWPVSRHTPQPAPPAQQHGGGSPTPPVATAPASYAPMPPISIPVAPDS